MISWHGIAQGTERLKVQDTRWKYWTWNADVDLSTDEEFDTLGWSWTQPTTDECEVMIEVDAWLMLSRIWYLDIQTEETVELPGNWVFV